MEARNEWDGVFSDLQSGMIEIKSKELAQLVSFAGWLRGHRSALYTRYFRIIPPSAPQSYSATRSARLFGGRTSRGAAR